MKRKSSALARVASALSLFALAACSGSSSGGAVPAPPSPSSFVPFTLAQGTRGTLQLAMDAVRLDEYYARFLRPGLGTVLTPPGPQAAPRCSPSTATATSSTGTIQTTVFYPTGDSTCHESPVRVVVVAFAAGAVPTAYGYQLSYASKGDPTVGAGNLAEVEYFRAAIYNASDGSAAMDISDSQTPALAGFPQTTPARGTFPATFPIGLPLPVLELVASNSSFAASESSARSSTAGTASLGSSFVNPFAVVNNLQAVGVNTSDAFSVTASPPDAAGNVSISWIATAPLYQVDPLSDEQNYAYSFPLASGNVSWALPGIGPLGSQTTEKNFSANITGTATFARNGQLTACSHAITDAGNGISASATCTNGGAAIDLTVTDLHASKPSTSPGTIVIDAFGNGAEVGTATALSYTVLFDRSQDQLAAFTIEPAL